MSKLKTHQKHPKQQNWWHLCDFNSELSNFQQSCRFPSCQKQHTLNQNATSLFLLPTRRGGREKDHHQKCTLKKFGRKFSTFFIERSSRWTTALFVRSPLSWKGNCNKFGTKLAQSGVQKMGNEGKTEAKKLANLCKSWEHSKRDDEEGDNRRLKCLVFFFVYLVLILIHSVNFNYTLIHRREKKSETMRSPVRKSSARQKLHNSMARIDERKAKNG